MKTKSPSSLGYTLVELSIVIGILAILAAGALTIFDKKSEADRIKLTERRISEIHEAIQSFYDLNGYIPCPAPAEAADDAATFGLTDSAPANNYDTALTPPQCADDAANSNLSEAGTVPTRTLNLPDYMMYDGWNRRFTYRTAVRTGSAGSFADSENVGDLAVYDIYGVELTDLSNPDEKRRKGAAYVIISHGSNGYYATGSNGFPFMPTTTPDSRERDNYFHDENKTYLQGERTSFYDDIVSFKMVPDIKAPRLIVPPILFPDRACDTAGEIAYESNVGANTSLGTIQTDEPALANAIKEAANLFVYACSSSSSLDLTSTASCAPGLRLKSTGDNEFDCSCARLSQNFTTEYDANEFGQCSPVFVTDQSISSDFSREVESLLCIGSPLDTGLDVTPNNPLVISYKSGTWQALFDGGAVAVNAEGHTGRFDGVNNPVPSANTGALIARIGPAGTWFKVGSNVAIDNPNTGGGTARLYLSINEAAVNCSNNTGSLKVEVRN
jgi:prepilin-type N-terminal cleavage/methylation domain-containing protein